MSSAGFRQFRCGISKGWAHREFCRSVFCPEPACSRALHLPRSKVLVSQLAHVGFGAVALSGVSVPVFPLRIKRRETAFVCPTRVDRRHITPHTHTPYYVLTYRMAGGGGWRLMFVFQIAYVIVLVRI